MHPFDALVAEERAHGYKGLRAWPIPSTDASVENEVLYVLCVRPSPELREQVLADLPAYNRSFGLDPDAAATTRTAWETDLERFMEGSDYTMVPAKDLFEVSFTKFDPDVGPFPLRLFARTITESHAGLFFHQPSVQLTPMLAGIVTTRDVVRSSALRLSHMETIVVPPDILDEYESTLSPEEVLRLAYANSRIGVPLVFDAGPELLSMLG